MPNDGPLTLGLIASSHKENERRVAIHREVSGAVDREE